LYAEASTLQERWETYRKIIYKSFYTKKTVTYT